ncbi:polyadenylate-binding protein [Coprinopsis cinerea AmutBmut pab1-1]|nr:polyadenylate-binding protein [Coprinopsis cinerea AmutBmut pab1-1]
MSDLDADLYGDLYGNDETDFNEQNNEEQQQDVTATDAGTKDSEATTTPATETKPASNGTTTQSSSTNGQTSTTTTTKPATSTPIATYTSQQPQLQQIPTYEEPQPVQSISRPDSGALNKIPSGERTVRPSEMKDEGKMFIGGLNWDTTDEGLRDYFSQFGKVDACTIMRDAAGRSRCFAFLTFEDPASVNAVMVREHILDGKIIDPKRAIPRQEHQRATKLFIGGLPGSVTSESMREFFSQFGKVIDSTVMLDRETGRSKGFGFISFEDTDVRPFLGFGNLEIDGKLIDVKLAQPRYQRDNMNNEDGQNQDGYGGGSGGRFNAQGSSGAGAAGNFGSAAGGAMGGAAGGAGGAGAAGGATFDPQALAALYTRMIQMAGGGAMNPAMMGNMAGMNPMMGAMGAGGFAGGMRPGMGMGMNMGMGMGNPAMGGMGRGGPGMMGGAQGGAGGAGGVPRGPRGGAPGAQGGPPAAGMGNAGVGPQRSQRGTHNFHPYAR